MAQRLRYPEGARQSTHIQDLRAKTGEQHQRNLDTLRYKLKIMQENPSQDLVNTMLAPSMSRIVRPPRGGVATEHRQIQGDVGHAASTGDLLRGLLVPVSDQYESGVGARFRDVDVGPYKTIEARPQPIFIPDTSPRPRTPGQQLLIDTNTQRIKEIMTGLAEGKIIEPLPPLERVPTPPRPRPGGRPPYQEPHTPGRDLLEALRY